MYWDVIELKLVKKECTLWVRFADNTNGHVQLTPSFLTGVFEPLREPDFFSQAFLLDGAVAWPREIDLAPDAMYHEIKKNGCWILT